MCAYGASHTHKYLGTWPIAGMCMHVRELVHCHCQPDDNIGYYILHVYVAFIFPTGIYGIHDGNLLKLPPGRHSVLLKPLIGNNFHWAFGKNPACGFLNPCLTPRVDI